MTERRIFLSEFPVMTLETDRPFVVDHERGGKLGFFISALRTINAFWFDRIDEECQQLCVPTQ